jgi:predicted transglutaminase-like cysteine proteinase
VRIEAGIGRRASGLPVLNRLACICAGLLASGAFFAYAAVAPAEYGYTTAVSPGLVQKLVQRFGAGARNHVAGWTGFARNRKAAAAGAGADAWSVERLQSINSFLNTVPWFSDAEHWGADDYWATPAETVASHGADCEDFAIAKYFLLKELGVPVKRLRITYVRAVRIQEPHMVLAYYPSVGADPMILDNLDDRVRPASSRNDLVPVYSFNDDDVVLVRNNQRGNVSQIRNWRQLYERLAAEARM